MDRNKEISVINILLTIILIVLIKVQNKNIIIPKLCVSFQKQKSNKLNELVNYRIGVTSILF